MNKQCVVLDTITIVLEEKGEETDRIYSYSAFFFLVEGKVVYFDPYEKKVAEIQDLNEGPDEFFS